jgi:hypothetical protein
MLERGSNETKRKECGRRLYRIRAVHIWRQRNVTRHVRRYLREQFSSVCPTSR